MGHKKNKETKKKKKQTLTSFKGKTKKWITAKIIIISKNAGGVLLPLSFSWSLSSKKRKEKGCSIALFMDWYDDENKERECQRESRLKSPPDFLDFSLQI